MAWQRHYIRSWEAYGSCCGIVKHLAKLSHEMLGQQTLDLQAYSSKKWLEKARVSGYSGYYWLPFANVLQMISSGKNWGVSVRDWGVERSSDIKGLTELAKLLFLVLKEREIRFKMVLRDKYPLTFLSWTKSHLWSKVGIRMLPPCQYQLIARGYQGLRH